LLAANALSHGCNDLRFDSNHERNAKEGSPRLIISPLDTSVANDTTSESIGTAHTKEANTPPKILSLPGTGPKVSKAEA